jgi:YD repeat-containing protein
MNRTRLSRRAIPLFLFACLVFSLSTIGHSARQPSPVPTAGLLVPAEIIAYHGSVPETEAATSSDQGSGIKEDIAAKYAERYQNWKKEFLSTDAGRTQWAYYQNNPHFILTITMSRENSEGATTGKYKWNEAGQLIAATITLGSRLDEGYPNPIYFPVMNSLGPGDSTSRVEGTTLAATKIAHEFGHVNRTSKADPALYQLQSQLIPQYNSIFLTNGRNANDPKLIELAKQIGGTPVEIWEDREYWGEANAMVYIRDRVTEDSLRCLLFTRIRRSVDLYAKSYERRFFDIVQANPNSKMCGWQ